MSITISYCRRYWKQLSTGTKLIALCLICIWVLSKAFIVMCKWSEGPSYQPCVEYIDHMCAEFSRHRISGNLCTELCHNTSAERFHCEHNSSGEKKVIVYIKDEDTKLVLKSGAYTSWDSVAKNYTSIKTLRPHVLSKDSLVEKLYSKFRQYFLNNETFGRFVSHLDVNSHNVLGAAVSGESLLQQDEYITSMNYQSKEVVPGLLGVCGNFYVSDYTPTDGALLTNRPGAGWPWRSVGEWKNRRTVAIRLLELAERLDNNDLLLCDVKGDNFGVLEDGKIAVLDSDTLFTRTVLGDVLKEDTCSSDSDCSFWDCHGTCDQKSWKCSTSLANTNFQMICSKIFRHDPSNGYHGILEDVPAKWQTTIWKEIRYCKRWRLSIKKSRNHLYNLRKALLHDQILG